MSDADPDRERSCRGRIKQVFEFLKALNEHRNPAVRRIQEQPWSMWLDDLPDHPSIERPVRTLPVSEGEDAAAEVPDYLLRVRRPRLTPPPDPPGVIADWLLAGWDDPAAEVRHADSRNDLDDEGETVTVRFEDDPNRPAALAKWGVAREAWQRAERPARAADRVFGRLYELHGRLARESERYDLVAGDGLLSWGRPDGGVYHPLLIQRAQLVFDAKVPEFRVVDADARSELYTSLFQSIPEVDPGVLAARRQEFEDGGYHPLSEEASAFLQGFANQLSSQGQYVGNRRPERGTEPPAIGRGPVLFLRARAKGFGGAIEKILAGIEGREEFCEAIRNIVGCETAAAAAAAGDDGRDSAFRELPQRDVLFGKEANPEQVRIARQLERHGAVLVQGPPGTGKSHTIANVIGHLLAQGKSVLVTSHTTKALKVLRGHVAPELRPLCVSVLESDLDSRRQLEESVQAISRRLSEGDADALAAEAETLARHRDDLLRRLEERQSEMLRARADEYRPVVFAGRSVDPSQAARKVAEGRGVHDWIPAPVAAGEPLPLTASEVRELYGTNQSTDPRDDRYVGQPLPSAAELPSPEDFASTLGERDRLAEEGELERRLWPGVRFTDRHIDQIAGAARDLREVVREFRGFEGWRLAAVDAGRGSGRAAWDVLLRGIEDAAAAADEAQTDLMTRRPEAAGEQPLEEQRDVAAEVRRHIAGGGRLGVFALAFRPRWKASLAAWRVDGRPPATADDVVAIERLLRLLAARRALAPLWAGLMARNGAPAFAELGDEPERSATQFVAAVRDALEWWPRRWAPAVLRLRELGFAWDRFLGEQPPDLGPQGEIRRTMVAVELVLLGELDRTANYLRSLRVKKQLQEVVAKLRPYDRPEAEALRRAIERDAVVEYRTAMRNASPPRSGAATRSVGKNSSSVSSGGRRRDRRPRRTGPRRSAAGRGHTASRRHPARLRRPGSGVSSTTSSTAGLPRTSRSSAATSSRSRETCGGSRSS